jgi:hypothetical protein
MVIWVLMELGMDTGEVFVMVLRSSGLRNVREAANLTCYSFLYMSKESVIGVPC